jgi:zinc/manganese transport system substrate-binding protein
MSHAGGPAARSARLSAASTALLLLACGCGATSAADTDADLRVVASTDVWGDIASTIAGPRADVTSFITSPAQDPHSFEPSARDVLAVSKADVVIVNGGGYDDFMSHLLDAADADGTVLDAVDISRASSASTDDTSVNEHVWYDLPTVGAVAARMATAFEHADPAHAAQYRANARTFARSVDALTSREADMRRRLAGTPVGITEPVPLYLLDAIGADNVTPEQFSAAVEGGEEVSVSVLEHTLSLYTDHEVSALVYNDQTTGLLTDRVEQAAEDAGIPVVGVSETLPDGLTYLSWMRANLTHLDAAMTAGR